MSTGRRGGVDQYIVISGGSNDPWMIAGTVDPSAGGGVPAPEGSIYLRYVAAAGEFWVKTGAANTAWSKPATVAGQKEVFVAATDYNANLGDVRVRNIAGTGGHRFTFQVPPDFTSLVSIGLIGSATSDQSGVDIDLTSDYGAVGQPYNQHSESDLVSTYNVTTNLFELDISSVFSSLAAGDYCGVFVDHNGIGATVAYYGARLVYS